MNIKITDTNGRELFSMAFAFEVDIDFVPKLIKFVKKHKISEEKKEEMG
jgi:hypothetical protein